MGFDSPVAHLPAVTPRTGGVRILDAGACMPRFIVSPAGVCVDLVSHNARIRLTVIRAMTRRGMGITDAVAFFRDAFGI